MDQRAAPSSLGAIRGFVLAAAAGLAFAVLAADESTSFELPPDAEICAEMRHDSEHAMVWTTGRGVYIQYHFVALAPDGTARVGPIEVGGGGEVEPSCGLAYRDGHYAVVWAYYDGLVDHEGDLTFANLDRVTGRRGAARVLDETKGGDEHTVDSFAAARGGYALHFHTTVDPHPRRLDLDPDGNVRDVAEQSSALRLSVTR